ncbi:MAG TPA: hypothetical protein VHO69_03615 [Phototrophicaceae bacterium]|nr:hypothetical protein [Phototrophicaceae bacterium]
MIDTQSITQEELELALEKAYRRGFHQALTLLATFYPNGVGSRELVRIANEHLQWRRELGPSRIMDSAPPRFVDEVSPLERELRGVGSA